MAITLITQPSPTTPIVAGQYTQQNKKINANTEGHAPEDFVLTDLVSTVAAPLVKQGCYIRHAGNSYQVDTADEAISGSVSAGLNYVKLTVSGSTLLASWVTSFSGYTYNEAYGGWYIGTTDQILPQGVYLDGTTYNRVKAVEKINPHVLALGDGSILSNDKAFKNVSGDFLTGGNGINTGNGSLNLGTGSATCKNIVNNGRTSSGSFTINASLGSTTARGDFYDMVIGIMNTSFTLPTYTGININQRALILTGSITIVIFPNIYACAISSVEEKASTSEIKIRFLFDDLSFAIDIDSGGNLSGSLPSGATLSTINGVVI